ncbi:hypothetical protein MKQ70_17795 [Chitinophaga sedimenti]|uniref:RNA polymerase sigma factor n=1 Tax=Chitinophaga sedimenti TaxID=2033606 RepID=UPI0020047D91|nr:sigma factor [Chitinophaga sedimenti]MCK7556769.1 hypothetical protein [Chitinophaga sedimenti]
MAEQDAHNEKELLKAVASGDEKAFGEIFHRYRNKVYTIAFRITASAPLSEEIVLDVFLKAWLKREQLATLEHFSAWLFTVTRNRVFSLLKQIALRKEAEAALEQEAFLPHENPNALLQEKEYRRYWPRRSPACRPNRKKYTALLKRKG